MLETHKTQALKSKIGKIEVFHIRGDRKSVKALEKEANVVKWQSFF